MKNLCGDYFGPSKSLYKGRIVRYECRSPLHSKQYKWTTISDNATQEELEKAYGKLKLDERKKELWECFIRPKKRSV